DVRRASVDHHLAAARAIEPRDLSQSLRARHHNPPIHCGVGPVSYPMLAAWGRVVHRFRWPVLLLSLVPLLPAAWLLRREAALEEAIRNQVRSDALDVVAVGVAAMNYDFSRVAREDLRRSELVVLPLVLVLLLLVFGSAVAAALPLLVGMLAVALGLAGTVIL